MPRGPARAKAIEEYDARAAIEAEALAAARESYAELEPAALDARRAGRTRDFRVAYVAAGENWSKVGAGVGVSREWARRLGGADDADFDMAIKEIRRQVQRQVQGQLQVGGETRAGVGSKRTTGHARSRTPDMSPRA